MKLSHRVSEATSRNDAERPPSAPNGRDQRGRFTAGNAGGPGNPFARRVARLRSILMECVSDHEMEEIVCQLVVMAKFGDLAAIKLLFQYLLGKPGKTIDPDTLDAEEADSTGAEPCGSPLNDQATKPTSLDLLADVLRGVVPVLGREQADRIGEALSRPKPVAHQGADEKPEKLAAPSTNGEPKADPRPEATRLATNGGAGREKSAALPSEHAGNGKPTPRPGGRTFIDPRQRG
jgi:hypothetical protein